MFCDQLIFVFAKLPFDHLFYKVDRYVHVVAFLLRADEMALYRDGNFDFLAFFLDTECYMDFRIRSEIAFQFPQLAFNSSFQPGCYINVLSYNDKFH